MKTITKEFLKKIKAENGILDTGKYRYWYIDDDTARRTELAKLDTTAMLEPDAWEIVKVR